MSDERSARLEVKVGLFVLVTVSAAVVVIFLLGQKRHVWEERVHVVCHFEDVGGLVVGAPVQIAGVNVGIVSKVGFERRGPRPRIRVELEIARDALDLVRQDSLARITSLGLLGDKLIDVSPGTRSAPALQPGAEIAAAAPADLQKVLTSVTEVLEKTKRVADDAAQVMDEVAAPHTLAHLRGSIASIHALLAQTEHGPGLMHALFYDRRTAEDLRGIADWTNHLVTHVDDAVKHMDRVLGGVDQDGRALLNNLSRAARSVGEAAGEVQHTQLLANLERASFDLAAVMRTVRSGQGTLGALVQDPTVYEQLVTILGGIGRSRILRALVRYAISRDDAKVAQRVVDEPPGHSTPKSTLTTKR